MAEGIDTEDSVVFPCDLPQWTSISIQLSALLSIKNPNRLISKLREVQEQVPVFLDSTSSSRGNAFKGLAKFLFEEATEDEQDLFFNKTFPCIIRWCLRIDQLRPVRGLRISRQHEFGQTIISRQLAASILACAFLSLFPYKRNKDALINPVNFDNFFSHPTSGGQYAKLRCILHYYERLADLGDGPYGNLVFTRKGMEQDLLPELDDWCSHCQLLCPLHVHPRGLIMDAPPSVMQVHFSNRRYGGNVLGPGQTQEDLRLCQSPELLIGMLFMESLAENEAIWVQGHEIFSMCSGHAHSLKYTGDFRDPARPLPNGELPSLVCCMDPLPKASKCQYEASCVLRELNKAYAGFFCPESLSSSIALTGELQPVSESSSQAVCQFAEALSEAIMLAAVRDICFPGNELPRSSTFNSSSSSSSGPSSGGSDGYHPQRWTKDRSDSESSHDGHPPYDIDKSWLMSLRRRSSNLSDVSSRRSSDLASRRSSSSTRQSSDFSSEFEDYFETFQRQELRRQHAVIKEETSTTAVQDFVGSLVTDMMKEGTSIAAQMAPGVQDFAAYQPVHVARPTPVKLQPCAQSSPGAQGAHPNAQPATQSSHSSSSSSSNQTDDQKLQGNIVTYVERLLNSSLQNVQSESRDWMSGRDRLEELGAVGGVPGATQDPEPPRESRSWELLPGRSPTRSEVGGSPSLSSHSGESLTDDLKQAVVESVRNWPRRSHGGGDSLDTSFDEFHINIPVGCEDGEPSYVETPTGRKSTRERGRPQRSASLGSALTYRRLSEGFLQERMDQMYGYAEDVVMNSIQHAVEEVYGYKEIPIAFSRPQDKPLSRSLPSRHSGGRKGSMDDTLTSFANHLARRCSLDDLNKTRRRSSGSGFRDATLSSFEDELMRSNPRLELFEPLSHKAGSSSSLASSTHLSRCQSSDFMLFSSASREGRTYSSNVKGERDSPLCKAILLDFLSKSSNIDSSSTRHSMTSNLEWFAQDLLLDSFNDAFMEIYGNDYADDMVQVLIERTEESESEVSISTTTSSGSFRTNLTLESYVENIVNTAMQEALQVMRQQLQRPQQRSRRSVSVETGEEDVESLYEDAIDLPYNLLDKFAVAMSSNIMDSVRGDLKKRATDRQVLQDEYYQRRRRWRRRQRFPGGGHPRAVATGNWGCGAQGGDPQLKLLLQWVAASIANVCMLHYYTCSDEALAQVRQVCTQIIQEGWTAADLLERTLHACHMRQHHHGPSPAPAIFDLIFVNAA